MTHEVVSRSTTTEYIFKEKLCTKDLENKIYRLRNDGKTSNDGDASTGRP